MSLNPVNKSAPSLWDFINHIIDNNLPTSTDKSDTDISSTVSYLPSAYQYHEKQLYLNWSESLTKSKVSATKPIFSSPTPTATVSANPVEPVSRSKTTIHLNTKQQMLLSLDLAAEKLSQGDTVAAAKILDKAAINARSAARLLDPKSTDAQLLMVFAQNMESRSKLYQSSSTNDTMRVVPHLSGSAHNAEELAQRLDKQGMNSDARLLRAIAADSFMQASIGLEGARSTKALVGEGLTNTYQQVVNASFDMKISEASTWKLWRDKSPADSLKQDKQKMEVVFSELKRTMKEHGVSLDQAWNDMLKDNSISSGRRVPGFITRHEAAVFLRDHEVTKNLLVPFADMAGGFNEGDAGAIDRAQARVVKVLRENGQWEAARAVLNAHMKEARTVEGRAEADRLNGSENREWWRAKAGEFARKELPVLLLTTAVSGGVGTGARALAMTAGLGTRVGSGVAVAAEIGAFVPVERILNEAINGKRGDWTANGLGRDYALAVAGYSAFKVVGLGWKAVRESGLGKNIIGGPKGSGEVVEVVTPEGMRVKVSRRELEELATVQGSKHTDAGGPVGRPKPIRTSTSGSGSVEKGRVDKPGNRPELRDTWKTDADVPEHYRKDPRFKDLASDPDHAGAISPKTRAEAMAGLEAERQGLVKGPIKRGPKGTEFYDADGKPWDVKTPPSPKPGEKWRFDANRVGKAIQSELREKAIPPGAPAGTFPHGKTGKPELRRIILDSTYLNKADHEALWQWLKKNLTKEELSRIVEINTQH
jgi:hypothetical protein